MNLFVYLSLHAWLQQHVNQELPDVQAGFRKDRGTRDQIANICWIIEKARKFQKKFYFCFLDYVKAFMWITTNCGKLLKRWEYQATLPAFWETCMLVKKQQLEPDMEQWNDSKLGKEHNKAVTLLIQLICRVHRVKFWTGWSSSWIQDCQEEYQ